VAAARPPVATPRGQPIKTRHVAAAGCLITLTVTGGRPRPQTRPEGSCRRSTPVPPPHTPLELFCCVLSAAAAAADCVHVRCCRLCAREVIAIRVPLPARPPAWVSAAIPLQFVLCTYFSRVLLSLCALFCCVCVCVVSVNGDQ